MRKFAILVSSSTNRVYTRTSVQMMKSEMKVFNQYLLDGSIEDLGAAEIGGIPYVTFHANEMSEHDLRCLSNLSSLYALFEVSGSMLKPIAVDRLDRYEDDLISIQKYVGKTNEHFTKLLLNVTAAVSDSAGRSLTMRFKVLDPMCGRGTTLNQAVMYGWDAYGVEINKRDYEAYAAFIQRWMKSKSIKHKAVTSRVRREGKSFGRRLSVEFAATKTQYKAGELQTLEMVNADTVYSGEIYKKRSFDLIATDAPYGIQHTAANTSRSKSRSPKELLESAIPVWAELLRAGGAVGLSWNTHVLNRDDLEAALSRAGLEVESSEPFLGFGHRVDQGINRDLVVARKPT